MNRRKFVRNTGIVLGGVAVAGVAGVKRLKKHVVERVDASHLLKDSKTWMNWSKNQECTPKEFFLPTSEIDLAERLKSTSSKIRVVGGGHSFSPVVPTNDILTSLKNLKGIISYDLDKSTAVVRAGTHIYDLTPQLHELGLAFINLGDIDRQSLAGAISTSTHGTGKHLKSISSSVLAFRMVTANGEIIDCSPTENPEIFYGGTVALGSLGIVTQYTLQLEPTYKLKEVTYSSSTKETMLNFDKITSENRNFEFFPFLHSDTCVHKVINKTNEEIKNMESGYFEDDFFVSAAHVLAGKKIKNIERVQDFGKRMYSEEERVGYSHHVYVSNRNVIFNEIEYQMPIEKGLECLEELFATAQKQAIPITYPMEVRVVKGDDFWMSPFYQRDSMSISIHQLGGREFEGYFREFDKVFKKYDGRPHWGKLSYQNAEDIAGLYSSFDEFVALKKTLDPNSRFSNDYMVKMFGV